MKLNYLITLGAASTALVGYFIYRKYKNHSNIKKKVIQDYDTIMKILKKLESDSTLYPLIIKRVMSKKDNYQFREKVLNQFVQMAEQSKEYACQIEGFALDKFNKIIEENKNEPNIYEYIEGYKTMCNVFIDSNYPPICLPSDFRDNEIMKRIVKELIVLWDKKIASLTEKLCIDSLYCHYEILNILDNKDLNQSDFKELVVRIHSLYLDDVLEIARNYNYNFMEFYTALACNFHFRSKMLLFHKACGDDIMRTCSLLISKDKNEEMDLDESISLFMDITEKSFRLCKDYINKRLSASESLNYKDLIKEKDFQKYDCFIMHNLWDENKMEGLKKYYDMMYTLKKNYENDYFKTDIFNYSKMIDIPYKFIMQYIKINSELDQLGLVRQKSLYVDYIIIQRQAVSLISMQLMDENKAIESYDLFMKYINILDDEEVNTNGYRIKKEIENKSKILLELYDIDKETLDTILFLLKNSNDNEIKKWEDDCLKEIDMVMAKQLFFIKQDEKMK